MPRPGMPPRQSSPQILKCDGPPDATHPDCHVWPPTGFFFGYPRVTRRLLGERVGCTAATASPTASSGEYGVNSVPRMVSIQIQVQIGENAAAVCHCELAPSPQTR